MLLQELQRCYSEIIFMYKKKEKKGKGGGGVGVW